MGSFARKCGSSFVRDTEDTAFDEISEFVNEIILAENEARKDTPMPKGSLSGLDDFMDFVNTHQVPTPKTWSHHDMGGLPLELPESVAVIYMVLVPANPAQAVVQAGYVPIFDQLKHAGPSTGTADDLSKIRRHLSVWTKHPDFLPMKVDRHIDAMGVIPERRQNNNAVFTTLEEAEVYADHIRANPPTMLNITGALSMLARL